MAEARVGRSDKRAGGVMMFFDYWWAFAILAAAAVIIVWQVTVALTTDVPLTDLGTTMRALRQGQPIAGLPGGNGWTLALAILEIVILVGIIVAVVIVRSQISARTPGKGQATRTQHKARMSIKAVREREGRLWPKDGADVPDDELAFLLGDTAYGLTREKAYAGQEDHVNVLAPTGVGKTYRVMSRACLDAPGALVTTSTRPDVLDVIAEHRERKGRIWVFDLLDLAGWPERMFWDFVSGCEDTATARARAGQIVKGGQKKKSGAAGGGDSNAEFFQDNARDVLQCYLHAAALGGHGINDIVRWAANFEADTTAMKILREHADADPMLVHRLNSLRTGAPETVASTRNTLDQGLSALALRRISRQFEADDDAAAFSPDAFARSTDTLVIIADNNDPTDVTGLAAMLLNEVLQAGKRRARRRPEGRLVPPLRAVLDEVANIAPVPEMPEMLSDLRGYGTQIIFAIQSGAQAKRTWGDEGSQMLVDNSGVVLVLGGIKDPRVLEDFSKLAGQVDVMGRSSQLRGHGMVSGNQTMQENERSVLRTNEIAQLPAGYAFAFSGTVPPVRLRMPAWTDRPDGEQLKASAQRTAKRRSGANERDERRSR